MCFSNVNEDANPDDYNRIKNMLGPFEDETPTGGEAAGLAASSVGGATPRGIFDELATVITGTEDRKENTRLKKGENKLYGVFVTGEVKFEEGTLTMMGLPVPTEALKKALNTKTLDERAEELASIVDSNNARRAPGSKLAIESCRLMTVHPGNSMRQLAMGRFGKKHIKSLTEKNTELSVVNFLHLEIAKIESMTTAANTAAARQAQDGGAMEGDVMLLVADTAGTISSVLSMIANVDSMSEGLWVGATKPLITQAAVFIFDKLQEADVQEYIGKLDEIARAKLSYHLISRLDWFVFGIQGVSLDYENVAAIAGRNQDELKLIAYMRIVKRLTNDLNDLEKAVYGGREIDPSFTIMPSRQVNKKPRFNQDLPLGGEAPRNAGWQGNNRRPDAPAASQRVLISKLLEDTARIRKPAS